MNEESDTALKFLRTFDRLPRHRRTRRLCSWRPSHQLRRLAVSIRRAKRQQDDPILKLENQIEAERDALESAKAALALAEAVAARREAADRVAALVVQIDGVVVEIDELKKAL